MQTQDQKRTSSSGHGVHVCHKCGWPFPNPHPSAKHRRSHKKICGTIEGYKIASSEEDKPDLNVVDDDEDDSKSPSLNLVKKAEEMTIIRRSSSGVGSRSSRSDEDVFTDAATDFGDAPPVSGYVSVRERAGMMQDLSEDFRVTQLDGENAVAGDLYPPNIDNGAQPALLQDVECSRPENDRLERDMPPQLHVSRSTVDSISNSDSSVKEDSVLESTLRCSKTDIVLDSEEKGSLEAALDNNSEDAANNSSENAGITSEAVVLPQKVNGDDLEFGEFGDNNDCSEKGTVEEEKSDDLTNIPSADFTGKTTEAVSEPQMVTEDNLEFLPADSVMEVIGEQGEEFDAKNDCFSKDDNVGQFKGIEEATNVEADLSLEKSDALPLEMHSDGVLEDKEDHKTEKLPDHVALDLAQDAEYVDHGMDEVNKGAFSSVSVAEPSKSLNKNSEQIISEALNQEDYSSENVSVEKKIESHATDADICEVISVIVHPDKDETEIGQDEMVTSPKEQNFLVFGDTNLYSVLEDSGNFTHSINGSEHNVKEAQIFDALEADSSKVEEEKIPLTTGAAPDYDVKSREVEEHLSRSTLTVAQSDDRMDDKVEVQRDDEHGSEVAMLESSKASDLNLQDSETEVNLSPNNQPVGEECVNLLGATVISGSENIANMTEETHFEENCAHKSSDSVDVSLLNNANHDSQQDDNEVFEDAKEVQNFDEKVSGEEFSSKVDLGLISDNDDDIVLTQNMANKIEAEDHVEAVSAVEDYLTEKKDGDRNLVQQEELDLQVDSVSQTDSLEGNWGSVSVLSAFSDAPAGTGSSVKLEKASLPPKSKLPDETTALEQKGGKSDQIVSSSSGSKKKEETMAKVTNWSTSSGKQHMSLKSFLGDDSSSPNNAKDNPPLKPEETEKAVMSTNTKDTAKDAAMGGMQKEWSSPARYPTNIKREEGKVRSKPYWAPFICCSSSSYQ